LEYVQAEKCAGNTQMASGNKRKNVLARAGDFIDSMKSERRSVKSSVANAMTPSELLLDARPLSS
jgi:hypothetical protein